MTKRRTTRALIALIIFSVISGVVVFFAEWSESYRIDKINFILEDNAAKNEAGLSPQGLAWYLGECGAKIEKRENIWEISYHGFFHHGHWIHTPHTAPTGNLMKTPAD